MFNSTRACLLAWPLGLASCTSATRTPVGRPMGILKHPMGRPTGHSMGYAMGRPTGHSMGYSMERPTGHSMGYHMGRPTGHSMGYTGVTYGMSHGLYHKTNQWDTP